jgi:hypothetical protein
VINVAGFTPRASLSVEKTKD